MVVVVVVEGKEQKCGGGECGGGGEQQKCGSGGGGGGGGKTIEMWRQWRENNINEEVEVEVEEGNYKNFGGGNKNIEEGK